MKLTQEMREEYTYLFQTCEVLPERRAEVDALIRPYLDETSDRVLRYKALGDDTGVPWFVIAVLHLLEAQGSFLKHLHNGDPLKDRTKRIPKGRPVAGNPPFTWEESARDALKHAGFLSWTDWTIAGTLFKLEAFNGFGYRKLPVGERIHSPYLWSFSSHYSKGKYGRDGEFTSELVSRQCGAGVFIRELLERGFIEIDCFETDFGLNVNAKKISQIAVLRLQRALNLLPLRPLIALRVDGIIGKKTKNILESISSFRICSSVQSDSTSQGRKNA